MSETTNFIAQLLQNRDKYGERAAYRYFENNTWNPVSWNKFLANIQLYASAMLEHGVKEGDHIALYAPNCHEWTEVDYACMAIKAVSVAIHSTSSRRAIEQMLEETEPKYIFVGNAELARKLEGLYDPKRLVLISEEYPNTLTLSEFANTSPREDWDAAVATTKPEDLWTIVYTSGTTGNVRGAMLTYGNIVHQVAVHRKVLPDLSDKDSSFCLLPLSHIFERGWSAIQYAWGMTHHYCPISPEVIKAIKSASPSVICVVPRIMEKIYVAFNDRLTNLPSGVRAIINKSLKVGDKYATMLAEGKTPSCWLKLEHGVADKIVLGKVRGLFGGKLKHCVVGSASLVSEVHRFFRAAGVFINNGYGLTETTATVTSTPIGHSLCSTVGTPLPGLEIRLGENDEIQIKGPNVMLGYYKNEKETKAAFTEDGFFRTGDVGKFLENGYLSITDRLKDFIRTSTGKYVSPQRLEGRLAMCPYIQQAAVVGEGRSWIGALIVPNIKKLQAYARQKNMQINDLKALICDPEIIAFVQKQIDELLSDEAKHERVHRIALLETPFSTENGEMTPTLKLRRKIINEHYASVISKLFE